MSENKKPKITFNPEFFKNFEGTQEELDALVAQLTAYAENLEFDELSEELSDAEIEINGGLILDDITDLTDEDIAKMVDDASEKYGLDNNGFVKYPFTLH